MSRSPCTELSILLKEIRNQEKRAERKSDAQRNQKAKDQKERAAQAVLQKI